MKLALVGEAWGEEEQKQRKPFVGRAGQQLDRLLDAAQIDRNDCLILNVINDRPLNNDFGVYYEDASRKKPTETLKTAQNALLDRLSEDGPYVVVALGNEALYALTGLRGIENYHGSILTGKRDIKVVPTFHPSAIIRGGGTSFWYLPCAINDLLQAKEELKKPINEYCEWPQIYITTEPKDLRTFLGANDGVMVSVDIEVSYKFRGEQVRCIAFSGSCGKAMVIPFFKRIRVEVPDLKGKKKPKIEEVDEPMMSGETQIEFQQLIALFFESNSWLKIGQNIQFDINVLRRIGWIKECKGIYMDTMVAHANCCQPEMPHSLGFLTSWYTRYPYYKYMINAENDEDFWMYNGYDAAVTYEVALEIDKEMKQQGTFNFYHDYINALVLIIAEMNFRGLKLDKEYQADLKVSLKEEIDLAKQKLDEITEKAIENHRSPKQISQYLYEVKKYKPVLMKGKITTNEVALKKLLRRTDDPALKEILRLRGLEKQLSSYANVKTDGDIVRTSYSFAKTGRFRSGQGDSTL